MAEEHQKDLQIIREHLLEARRARAADAVTNLNDGFSPADDLKKMEASHRLLVLVDEMIASEKPKGTYNIKSLA